jgi:hypothetical protein
MRQLVGVWYFKTASNVTDDVINEYINRHSDANEPQDVNRIRLD